MLTLAYTEMMKYPSLRLGQAFINVSPEGLLDLPWPELYNEECPVKASEIIYELVENGGKPDINFTGDI